LHSLLQLGIQYGAVGDDDDRVENSLILVIMQRGQPVGGPGDGVGLAGAGAVLDQVFVPRPFGAGGGHQAVDGIPLVETGED